MTEQNSNLLKERDEWKSKYEHAQEQLQNLQKPTPSEEIVVKETTTKYFETK